MAVTTPSFCRLCPAFCGLLVTVEGDRVVAVTGDPDNPVSRGYTCSKGRASGDLHHHPARLDAPLLGRPGDPGGRTTADWEHTLDHVAAGLRRVIAESGPNAVAAYRASGWGFDFPGAMVSDPFFRALGSDQIYSAITIDGPNKVYVPELIAGATLPWSTPDVHATDCLLFVGQNPLVSHGHANIVPDPVVTLRAVKARGTIVVADPRRTETARLADVHVPLRPGSDPAFLAFLVREALAAGPDVAYLEACADLDTVETVRTLVAPYTLAHTAACCDVPEATLVAARDAVVRGTRIGFASGTGASMNPAANVTEWLGWALCAVTGSLDRPGGTMFNPGFLRRREDTPLPAATDSGARARTRPDIPPCYGGLPTAALADEILAGNVRALFVMGGNPALVFPDTDKIRRALAALELLIVCDIRHTETTDLATVVLPVTGQMERADANTAMFHPVVYMQYTPALVPPGADRKPTSWVFAQLSARMGVPVLGNAALADRLPDGFTDDDVLDLLTAEARVPWAEVKAAPHGVVAADAPGPGWLIPDSLPRRLDLAPAPVVAQFADWATERAHAPTDPDTLVLVNRRLVRQMNTTLRDVGDQAALAPHPTLLVHPDDAARLGIADGATVEITSAHGATTARAEVHDGIRAGTVSVPHGFDGTTGPNVNALTSDDADCDPLTGMPRFSGLPVRLRVLAPA
jgi:anaerobic selenocysteine-containing dehydrogenase